jgi:predicted nucleotidyltransferase
VDDTDGGRHAREPQIEDLARICRALNDEGARYILIGGFAVIVHGGARTTKDIDLLIDASPENVARKHAQAWILEDRSCRRSGRDDIAINHRVADEIVVDLMAKACGIDFAHAWEDVEYADIGGVPVPVASIDTLIRTKDTLRPSDAADKAFLKELLRAKREPSS